MRKGTKWAMQLIQKSFRQSVVLAIAGTIASTSTVLAGGTTGQVGQIRLPPNGAAITFGRTAGVDAGFCSTGGLVTPAFSASIYRSGRVVLVDISASLFARPLSPVGVTRLIRRARRVGFFRLPTYIRDVPCAIGAATTYIRIRAGGRSKTVAVNAFLESHHPGLSRLFNALEHGVGIQR